MSEGTNLYQLIKQHTHAGVKHKGGGFIELTDSEARWLAAQGVIPDDENIPREEAAGPDPQPTRRPAGGCCGWK